jgi:hypothetical protein
MATAPPLPSEQTEQVHNHNSEPHGPVNKSLHNNKPINVVPPLVVQLPVNNGFDKSDAGHPVAMPEKTGTVYLLCVRASVSVDL